MSVSICSPEDKYYTIIPSSFIFIGGGDIYIVYIYIRVQSFRDTIYGVVMVWMTVYHISLSLLYVGCHPIRIRFSPMRVVDPSPTLPWKASVVVVVGVVPIMWVERRIQGTGNTTQTYHNNNNKIRSSQYCVQFSHDHGYSCRSVIDIVTTQR